MRDDRYRASALTAAVTGGDVLPSQSAFIPKGAAAIAAEAIAAAEAGATSVHLHAREEDGRPSGDPALFATAVIGMVQGVVSRALSRGELLGADGTAEIVRLFMTGAAPATPAGGTK